MCPADKFMPLDFVSYIRNGSDECAARTQERETIENMKYEKEIRFHNKQYCELKDKNDKVQKHPLINVCGSYKERHNIPTKFSYVYEAPMYVDYDLTILQDDAIYKYLNGKLELKGKVVADICEPPEIQTYNIYNLVFNNHKKFCRILT